MWHILVDCTCFVSLDSNQMVEKTEQGAGDGLGKAVPLLEGSIWPIVFSFIIVFSILHSIFVFFMAELFYNEGGQVCC